MSVMQERKPERVMHKGELRELRARAKHGWGAMMSPEQVRALVAYIDSLQPPRKPIR